MVLHSCSSADFAELRKSEACTSVPVLWVLFFVFCTINANESGRSCQSFGLIGTSLVGMRGKMPRVVQRDQDVQHG